MRKLLLCASALFFGASFLSAEPLTLEQAGNVLKPGTLEAGLSDIAYQTDETKFTDTETKLTRTATIVPLYARYAFTPAIEAVLNVPYNSVSSKTELNTGSTSSSEAGLGDPSIAGKYSFVYKGWDLAGVAAFSVPMGKEDKVFTSSFRQGMNIKPLIAARKGFGKAFVNANLSYAMTGEYTDANSIKRDPGDVMSIGIGGEHPCMKNPNLTWIGEFVYNSISEAKTASAAVADSSGSQMDLILGGRYNTGNIKTKLGVGLSLGDEKNRDFDYKIIAGVTYLINL